MTMIGIYVRVSSSSQQTESQEIDLKVWAKGKEEQVGWYRDSFTGKTMDRPGFNGLLADIRAGKVTTLVIWRLDRLGRTAMGLTSLFDELTSRKVNVVSLRDGLDLSTPAGRLMANVLSSVAQYETEVRSERQAAGIAVAKANGVRFGRPEGKGKRLKVTDEQGEQVIRLASEGMPKAQIARATGLSRPTIYAIISESD
jgi:DNA invertase Pin-like site-specific DNA recombinase